MSLNDDANNVKIFISIKSIDIIDLRSRRNDNTNNMHTTTTRLTAATPATWVLAGNRIECPTRHQIPRAIFGLSVNKNKM